MLLSTCSSGWAETQAHVHFQESEVVQWVTDRFELPISELRLKTINYTPRQKLYQILLCSLKVFNLKPVMYSDFEWIEFTFACDLTHLEPMEKQNEFVDEETSE